MPFSQTNSIRYYGFDLFDSNAITHAVFTRQGGLSPEPWSSLNVGASAMVLDDHQRVRNNRILAFEALKRDPASMYDVWQVHSADVICAGAPRPSDAPHIKADAILTDNPEVTLFMRFADCVPILLHDPVRRVVGIVHAGWQGTVKMTISATIEAMVERYLCKPKHILAGIGPSIAAHHYQVGTEVVAKVRQSFGESADDLLPEQNGAVQFDLWRANRLLLEQAGVHEVQVSGLCTACDTEDWFSHRAEKGQTGRFGVLIALNG
ncbi:MAG: peptidoglycan editing factor PgeF [Anaerolineales bacterium]|nr:peptidoglycan editing factor PgeF [Chloroflexota bacterium]MBL6982397.1 peptidoglycan editing factor PgeF [Anaerolineales bacterium]